MKIFIVLATLLTCSCGQSVDQAGQSTKKDPLVFPRQTRGLLGVEARFVAYAPRAQRISIIDPASEREASASAAPAGVRVVLPINRFDGIALIGPNFLQIRSAGGERQFPVTDTSTWDAADETASFVFRTAQGLHIIRDRTNGDWQDETLALGFDGASESATLLAKDGRTAIAMVPASGKVAVFQAASEADSLVATRTCNVAATAQQTTIAIDGTQLLVADAVGDVRIFDLLTCQENSAKFTPAEPAEVTRLTILGDNRIAAAQVGGAISVFNSASGAVDATLATGCDFPLAPTPLNTSSMALLCLSGITAAAADTIHYDRAALMVIDASSGQTKLSVSVDLARAAGLGLAAAIGKFFVLSDGPLGTMVVTDLATGAQRIQKRLFTNALLDEL